MYFTDINNREEAKKYCADVMCKVQRERANDDVIKTDEFLEKFQICNINFGLENDPPFGTFPKSHSF